MEHVTNRIEKYSEKSSKQVDNFLDSLDLLTRSSLTNLERDFQEILRLRGLEPEAIFETETSFFENSKKSLTKIDNLALEEANKRNSHNEDCSICLSSLNCKSRPLVLLSCSHLFHKTCVENLENFCQLKKCPICREENYSSFEVKIREDELVFD